jgi:L-fuconolactonase
MNVFHDDRDAWRAQTNEVALDPSLPIIDAHHHLWPDGPPVPGLEAYSEDELIADKSTSGHNIVGTVFVEAGARYRKTGPERLKAVGQTEYIEDVARRAAKSSGKQRGLCAGIVATADMMLGAAVEEVLLAHLDASPTRLRSIRFTAANDSDFPFDLHTRPNMLSDVRFREAVSRLTLLGLSLDVFVVQSQILEVCDLAAAFPDTTIVLNHVGGPMGVGRFANGAGLPQWRASTRQAAQQPNIYLKLGGLNMEYTGLSTPLNAAKPWSSQTLADLQRVHILTSIDLFGPNRCLFESNFPVDKMTTSYTILWNTFKLITGDFSPADKARLYFDTAKSVYRLDLSREAP